MSEKKVPSVLQYPGDYHGCGFWRMLWPQFILNMSRKATVCHSDMFIRDLLIYHRVAAVHIQRQGKPDQYEFLKKLAQLKKRMKFKLIYEVDDVVFPEDIPDYNIAKVAIMKTGSAIREVIELCDEMTVTTPYLRDYYLRKTTQKNITVIPNYPPMLWLGDHFSEELLLRNFRAHRKKPRILYAGSINHFNPELGEKTAAAAPDDFTHVREVIMANLENFRWVFVGGYPKWLTPFIETKMVEYHPWQPLDRFPRYLSKLEINMCIAPLIKNDFNCGKSDLKFLEASALGIPIACQDMLTYAVATIKFSTGEEMIKKIRETLASEETFLEASRRARNLIESRWLEREENIGKYLDVYCHPYGDSSRKYV